MHAHDILLSQARADANAASALLGHFQPAEAPPAAQGATLLWGKATTNWRNRTGNTSFVDVYPCPDKSGAGSTTPAVRVNLPRHGGADPNVAMDQVLGYVVDAAGENIAVAAYLDEAIGSVKIWCKTASPPQGWVECASGTGASPATWPLSGSFPVGKKTGDSDFGTLGQYGNQGIKTHVHNLDRDVADPPAVPVNLVEGTYNSMNIACVPGNHLPPWCVVRFIERIDNSI